MKDFEPSDWRREDGSLVFEYEVALTPKNVSTLGDFCRHEGVRTLRLVWCDLSAADVTTLLGPGLPGLEVLDLSHNAIGDAGAKALAHASLPRLRKLVLARTELEDEGLARLCVSPLQSTLTALDLDYDEALGERGLRQLTFCRELTQLRLSKVPVSTAVVGAWAEAGAVARMTVLILREAGLQRDALAHLAQGHALEALDLMDNGLPDAPLAELIYALDGLHLRELGLAGNEIGPRTRDALCHAPGLAHLDFLELGDELTEDLAQALSASTVLPSEVRDELVAQSQELHRWGNNPFAPDAPD